MDGELWKLREDAPKPRIRGNWRLMLVSIAGLLLICCGAGVLLLRAKPPQNAPAAAAYDPNKPRGLRLIDTKVTFAVGTIQTVDIRLPCSGLLTININAPKGVTLSAFLVSQEEREKMKARQTFAHVDGFDAKTSSGNYRQAAQLSPGRYCLVLLDEGLSRSVVEVSAHLSELK